MHITKKTVRSGKPWTLPDSVAVEGLPPEKSLQEALVQFCSWAIKNPDKHMEIDIDHPYNAADIFYHGDCYTIEPEGMKYEH